MSLKSQIQFPGVQMSCGMISRRLFNLSVPHSVFHPGKQGLCYWLPLEFGLLLLHENIYVSIHWETIRTWKNRTISTKGRFCQSHTEMHRRTQKESLRQWSLKESLWHPTPQTTGLNQSEAGPLDARCSSHCLPGSQDKSPTSDLKSLPVLLFHLST